jgi:hypothetical protein
MFTNISFVSERVLYLALGFSVAGCVDSRAINVAGRVLYSDSGAPAAGAYVLAAYKRNAGELFGHNSSTCLSTKGMITTADGAFSFPVEKDRQIELMVIKPDFTDDITRRVVWKEHWYGAEPVVLPDLYLERTPGGDGGINFAFVCAGATGAAALAANIDYLKLVAVEAQKYASPSMQSDVKIKIINAEMRAR